MNRTRYPLCLAIALCAAGTLPAADPETAAPAQSDAFKYSLGIDFRVREEVYNHIPIRLDPPGVAGGGQNMYFRFRTRPYVSLGYGENASFMFRLCNEVRDYIRPDSSKNYEWPDETVVDQLYVDLRNLGDAPVDVRIGRQDLNYGTGKVIRDGTAKDGSRTTYFDAVKTVLRGLPETTIDCLGIYNRPQNELAMSSEDCDLTGYDSAVNDLTESGGALYLQNKSFKSIPFETYYVFKHESDWTDAKKALRPERDLHTAGARIMPVLSPDRVTMNLEGAWQTGTLGPDDCSGYMVDGAVKGALPLVPSIKPALILGVYWLSGDDPDTADEESWNPPWARYIQSSDLLAYGYAGDGIFRWSNLLMPHVDLTVKATKSVDVTASAATLQAEENDGPGSGKDKGMLYAIRTDFVIAQDALFKKDKLAGHVVVERLDPGDYYLVSETAYFFRWEVSYAF